VFGGGVGVVGAGLGVLVTGALLRGADRVVAEAVVAAGGVSLARLRGTSLGLSWKT
jgi:hypothetical protein